MLVKICGITRQIDAERAVAFGAHALGFIFWPKSPRCVDPYRARAIAAALPPFVAPVGVFVDQPVDYVNGVASLVGLAAVQLHGEEDVEYAAAIHRPVVKAIGFGGGEMRIDAWPARYTLLLDAHDPALRGGTGRTIDWTRAATIAAARRTILSGGLTPENIASAIDAVRPFGVDVSSGVEDAPGIKNHERLQALFEGIHAVGSVPARS